MDFSPLRAAVLSTAVLVPLMGCESPQQFAGTRCTASLGPPMLVFTLFLGRSIPGRGEVSDRDWTEFLDRVVTANLPNGYTVFEATGAWMNPVTRKTIKERTKVLNAALPDTPDSTAAIMRIREAYQVQFHQQLVGMEVHRGCGSF